MAVFKIHTRDGKTEIIDPKDEFGAKKLFSRFSNTTYQNEITGISLLKECGGQVRCPTCKRTNLVCQNCGTSLKNHKCRTGVQYSISRPNGCRKVFYIPAVVDQDLDTKNKGGERVTVFVDGFKIDLMAHRNQPALSVRVEKPGVLRYNPI